MLAVSYLSVESFLADELATTLRKCAEMSNESTGSDSSFELASYWLEQCLSYHADCPKPSVTDTFIPSRVIDVGGLDESREPYLLDTRDQHIPEKEQRYVALSHCWGTAQIITTKLSTISDRHSGIPMATLPQTFQDAVIVTRRLALRYLWIDSLCIIQDSSKDWENESVQMCNIYRNAFFTIAAAHASSSSVGCFAQRDGILHLPFELSFPSLAGSEGDAIKAVFTPLPRKQVLDNSEPPLYGRAWVLQEQILSPRMLIYDGDQLRWECLSAHGSERSPLGGMSRHIGTSKAIRSGITDNREDFFTLTQFNEEFPPRYQHQDWCYAVMDYTHRGMTNQTDRLIAISGIAEAIQRRTKNVYLAGLWKDQLALGLLWNIPFEREFTPTTMFAFNIPPSTRHSRAIAPSWSWVSVTVPVVFPVPSIGSIFLRPVCEIMRVQVEGIPSCQTGTITVRGHVRQAYIKSIYPTAIRQASSTCPDYVYEQGKGVRYHAQKFHPNDFFLASLKRPQKVSQFQPVPGTWRPDELLQTDEPLTFIAIAQRPRENTKGPVGDEYENEVFALGLLPTRKADNEYRRVGYAVWADCSWYGYDCGEYSNSKPQGFASGLRNNTEIAMKKVRSWIHNEEPGVNRLLPYKRGHIRSPLLVCGEGEHKHSMRCGPLPDNGAYHKSVEVKNTIIRIV